jgi:hypothetical protein
MTRRIAITALCLAFSCFRVPMTAHGADVISNISETYVLNDPSYGFNPNVRLAFVFQTGPSITSLNSLALNLLLGNGTSDLSINFNISLYAVDGSNDPTGTALSVDNASATWSSQLPFPQLTPQVFTYTNLTNMFALNLAATTKYALVLSDSDGSPSFEHYWTGKSTNTYATSGGFSYQSTRRSTDNGANWSSLGSVFPIVAISAVPEPSTCSLAAISALVIGFCESKRARA